MVDVQSSATAPSFDAASAEAMAATLRKIIDKHGTGLLANHRKLFGLLRDYAPSEPRAIRVLMSAFDLGIAERLAGTQTMSPDALDGEARSLAADTGLRDDLARWAVDVWAKARTPLQGAAGTSDTPSAPPTVTDAAAQPAGGSTLTWGSIPVSPPEAPAVSAVPSTGVQTAPEPPPAAPGPASAPSPASITWGSETPAAAAPPPPLPSAPPAAIEPATVVAAVPPPALPPAAASLTWGTEPSPAVPPPTPAAAPTALEPAPIVAAVPIAVPAAPPAVPPAPASLTWGSEPHEPVTPPPPAAAVPPKPPLAIAPSVPPIAPNAPTVPPAPASLTWGSEPQAPGGPPPMAPPSAPSIAAPQPPTAAANVAWYLNPKVGATIAVICSIIYFGANYIGKHPFDAPAPTTPARPAADPVAPVKPAPVAPVAPADPGPAVVGSTSANPNDWPDISGSRIDGDKSTWKYEMNIKMPDGHFYIYEVSVKMTGIDVGIGVVRAVEWSKRTADVSFISVATRPIITRFFSDSSKSFHTSVSTPTWDKDPTSAPRLCFAFNSGTTKQRFQPDGGYVCASPMNGADCVDIPIGCGHFK